MSPFLIKALQLILSFSILIFVHELGHYLFARLFKIRVDKFYLFFDWGFSLFKYKPKGSDTEFGIGWLPLGGYCKIAGMVDESMDTEQLSKPAEPWEFRSKPAWQRLLVMAGGVIFNIILAVVIYTGLAFNYGDDLLPMSSVGHNIAYSSVGHDMGLKDGDMLLAVDGTQLEYYDNTLLRKIVDGKVLTVDRDGVKQDIEIPVDLMQAVIASNKPFSTLSLPAIIENVIPDSEASKADLKSGDKILEVNGATKDLQGFVSAMEAHRGDSVELLVDRNGEKISISAMVNSENKLGVSLVRPTIHISYSLLESVPVGLKKMYTTLSSYASSLKYLFTKEGASQIGGLGSIGSLFPESFNWMNFWSLTALISIILAVMNILPIPALDGGHIVFLLYEIITRKTPSIKVLERAQIFGLVLLFGLMLYANINDIIKFFFR
ncbi:zinc metalloprotease [Porphyromonas canoris]|uniref:Zinc metalloprotease n=1 Tax=Porphyromonas canoris TaxID=36875 RepID=A0ABR4XL88_9PORP|nr:RIP metalloprotease RseP [Porphyromonas canoris]KGL53882.1 zinc metalloprotease [Porphyromonas canoris]KGN92137.1 zinc metalloprotease [Porphyromonas canoris]